MKMAKRKVNLTLPEELWAKLRARVPERKLSQYVAEATAARLAEEERAFLRECLKEQCLARAAQDLELAEEFFAAEQEVDEQIRAKE
jgi:hypothetical protein